jgi:hypothetical protein
MKGSNGKEQVRLAAAFMLVLVVACSDLGQQHSEEIANPYDRCKQFLTNEEKVKPGEFHVRLAGLLLGAFGDNIPGCWPAGVQDLTDKGGVPRYARALEELKLAEANPEGLASDYQKYLERDFAQAYLYLGTEYVQQAASHSSSQDMKKGDELLSTVAERYEKLLATQPDIKKEVEFVTKGFMLSGRPLRALQYLLDVEPIVAKGNPGVYRLAAEAYFALGNEKAAGLEYEKWIGADGIRQDRYLHTPEDEAELRSRLKSLYSRWDHPNNIPKGKIR